MKKEIRRVGGKLSLSTEKGCVLLVNNAARLSRAWSLFLINLLRPFYDSTLNAPLFIHRQALADAKYLNHFPRNVFSSRGRTSSKSDEKFLTPAGCLHVYPLFKGSRMPQPGFSTLIIARCARYEGGKWNPPFRTADFHMMELVCIGEKRPLARKMNRIRERVVSVFERLGLSGKFVPATDAFFLGHDKGARIIQKLKGLKQEFIVNIGSHPTALASINDHEEYFGRRFDIHSGRNEAAHSFCAAFGIERLTHYSLMRWGENRKYWPAAMEKYVKIS